MTVQFTLKDGLIYRGDSWCGQPVEWAWMTRGEAAANYSHNGLLKLHERDQLAETIQQYDEFHNEYQPSQSPAGHGTGMEKHHGCHV